MRRLGHRKILFLGPLRWPLRMSLRISEQRHTGLTTCQLWAVDTDPVLHPGLEATSKSLLIPFFAGNQCPSARKVTPSLAPVS
jgi:hypothetical protein